MLQLTSKIHRSAEVAIELPLRAHYPGWDITKSLRQTFKEIHEAWCRRSTT